MPRPSPIAPSPPFRTRVVIADDHAAVRAGLDSLLGRYGDIEVVGLAEDGAAAERLCRALRPDVALLDLRMPGMDGIDVTRRIADEGLPTRVVVFSSAGPDALRMACDAGAVACLPKHAGEEEVVRAVRDAARGLPPDRGPTGPGRGRAWR